MAAGRHNLSRRALLGAGVVVPVILAGRDAVGFASAGEGSEALRSGPGSGSGGAGAVDVVASAPPGVGDALQPPAAGGKAHVPRHAWTRALDRYRRAEAALGECRARQAALPAAQRAFPHSQPLDDEFGRVDDVRIAALFALLRRPAPDIAALADKIELLVADQAWELTGAERCLERLRDDARRMAGDANASRRKTFAALPGERAADMRFDAERLCIDTPTAAFERGDGRRIVDRTGRSRSENQFV